VWGLSRIHVENPHMWLWDSNVLHEIQSLPANSNQCSYDLGTAAKWLHFEPSMCQDGSTCLETPGVCKILEGGTLRCAAYSYYSRHLPEND
jgi:hypothetical protein